jgi:hypothetical protein
VPHRHAVPHPLGVDVAERERLRRDPLLLPGDERPRAVVAHVLVQELPVGADGVVGELLAVDELLDVDHVDVARAA